MSDPRGPEGPLSVLSVGAAALARAADLDTALSVIVEAGVAAVAATSAAVFSQDPDRSGLSLVLTLGMADEAVAAFEAEVIGDAEHPIHRAALDRDGSLGRAGTGPDGSPSTVADLPLVVSRGGIEESLGVLTLGWAGEHEIGTGEETLLVALADLLAAALSEFRTSSIAAERAEWFERMAHTDPLTGLSNGRTLNRVLELEVARAQRQGSEVSVAMFDVDAFGALNRDAGSRAGDLVLREVAAVLAESVRLVDTIARTGADEFVLVAPGSAGVTVARRVLDGVARIAPVNDTPVSVSVGVARFPVDATDADGLLVAARSALDAAAPAQGTIAEAAGEGNSTDQG